MCGAATAAAAAAAADDVVALSRSCSSCMRESSADAPLVHDPISEAMSKGCIGWPGIGGWPGDMGLHDWDLGRVKQCQAMSLPYTVHREQIRANGGLGFQGCDIVSVNL